MQELGLVLVRSDELWTDKTEVELVQALDSGFLLMFPTLQWLKT
jgi:hypothetical protein